MTVIAWDGKTLAADKRCDIGGTAYTCTKIYRVPPTPGTSKNPETLTGFAGIGARFMMVLDWYRAGADPATYPPRAADDASALVCIVRQRCGGPKILRFEAEGYPLPIEDQYYAEGYGRDVALAAMRCGRSAIEAVELASVILPQYCGGGVDSITFGER